MESRVEGAALDGGGGSARATPPKQGANPKQSKSKEPPKKTQTRSVIEAMSKAGSAMRCGGHASQTSDLESQVRRNGLP